MTLHSAPAQARTLYVASGGNDNWTGTLQRANAAKTDGPFATLERGYAIVRDRERRIVRDSAQLAPADPLTLRLARGEVDVRVEHVPDSRP